MQPVQAVTARIFIIKWDLLFQTQSNFAASLLLCLIACWLPGLLCQSWLKLKPIKWVSKHRTYAYICINIGFSLIVAVTNINFKWLKSCVCIRLCCCMRVVWTKGNVRKSIAARKTKTCSEFIQSEILRSPQDVYDYGTLTLSDFSICTFHLEYLFHITSTYIEP